VVDGLPGLVATHLRRAGLITPKRKVLNEAAERACRPVTAAEPGSPPRARTWRSWGRRPPRSARSPRRRRPRSRRGRSLCR